MHTLPKEFFIRAREYYSTVSIQVKKGSTYIIEVLPNQKWKDLTISSDADGFINKHLKENKKRVKGVKCFALCGTIGKHEENHFLIGSYKRWTCERDGELFFFANDHRHWFFYLNNWGKIKIKITEIDL